MARLAILLIVVLAAAAMTVRAEDSPEAGEGIYEWTVKKLKEIKETAAAHANYVSEEGKKKMDGMSKSAKDFSASAKETVTGNKPEPETYYEAAVEKTKQTGDTISKKSGEASDTTSQAVQDVLEKAKKMASDNYEAAKSSSTESKEAAKQQYDTVSAKIADLASKVTVGESHEEL